MTPYIDATMLAVAIIAALVVLSYAATMLRGQPTVGWADITEFALAAAVVAAALVHFGVVSS